jgi:ribosomal protein L16 Arg81 hydroxylase
MHNILSHNTYSMNPHNEVERGKAFRTFLLFFTVTIAVIITAVFFSIQVPFSENDRLREENKKVLAQRNFSEDFVKLMQNTTMLLDSVNKPSTTSTEAVDAEINNNIAMMDKSVKEDSSVMDKSLYQNVGYTFSELRRAKKQLREVSGNDQMQERAQKEIERLTSRLDHANNQLQLCELRNQRQQ